MNKNNKNKKKQMSEYMSNDTVRKIRKAINFILSEPRRFNMKYAVTCADGPLVLDQLEQPPCGTACCFAGAVYLTGKNIKNLQSREFSWPEVQTYCIGYLGIDLIMADNLFHIDYWPPHFQASYKLSISARERAYVGAARFEHLVATGK